MINFLPKNRATLIALFLLLLFGAIFYILLVRGWGINSKKTLDNTITNNTENNLQNGSAAFFIPPTSQNKEVEVYGRIVKLTDSENSQTGATHKIVLNGNTLILAKTEDDKLKQQEGNTVTLVGTIPTEQSVSPQTVLSVDYIQFK